MDKQEKPLRLEELRKCIDSDKTDSQQDCQVVCFEPVHVSRDDRPEKSLKGRDERSAWSN